MSRPRAPRPLPARVGRLAAPVAIFTVVYALVLIYPPLRLGALLWPQAVPGTPELLALIVGPIAGRVVYELRPGPVARHLAAASLTWLGCAFLLFLLLLPYELIAAVFAPPPQTAGMVIAGLWALLCARALVGAQRLIVEEVAIPAPGLPGPMRLVQISDVHVGSRGAGFLARVVRRVAELEPDLVVVTGDLVDFAAIPAQDLAPLGALAEGTAPVFFCIGNHERYVDCDAICARLSGHGVKVLREQIDTSMQGLVIIGLDDAERRTRVREGLAQLAPLPEGFRLLLYHRPDGLEDAADAGVDLMLSGHTHYGQIVPFDRIVRRIFPRIRGLYEVGDTRLYVSPGTGTWGPVMRLGSACEITCLTLQPEG